MSFFSPSAAEDDVGEIIAYSTWLQATRGTHNPNLQVVIIHALHVSNLHSFELSHHARLDLLSLVIRSRVFDYLSRKTCATHSNEVKSF